MSAVEDRRNNEVCLIVRDATGQAPHGDDGNFENLDRWAADRYGALLATPFLQGFGLMWSMPLSPTPWAVIPRGPNHDTIAFFTYMIAKSDHDSLVDVIDRINQRAAAPVVQNGQQAGDGAPLEVAGLAIGMAIPNRGAGPMMFDYGDGGPGSEPEPVADTAADLAKFSKFQLTNNLALNTWINSQRGQPINPSVTVAILDTCSTGDVTATHLTDKSGGISATSQAAMKGWLLQQVSDQNFVQADVVTNQDLAFTDINAMSGNYDLRGQMASHGPFIAGIIRDLAPICGLNLIRVLGDKGLGNLKTIFRGLVRLGTLPNKPKLVINLSLRFDTPMKPGTTTTPPPPSYALDVLATLYVLLGNSVSEAIGKATMLLQLTNNVYSLAVLVIFGELANILTPDDVLIVAAAGNDGQANPNAPASYANLGSSIYSSILAVSATKYDHTAASYSNGNGGGVATLGGEADLATHTLATRPNGNKDAVVGISTDLTFAPTGWMYWAGTSFATAIISALAADLWLQNPGAPSGTIKQMLLALHANGQLQVTQ